VNLKLKKRPRRMRKILEMKIKKKKYN